MSACLHVAKNLHPTMENAINDSTTVQLGVLESRLRMARVPQGSVLIDNPTAEPHGFQIENVYVMAGVPMIMQGMLSTLTKERLGGGDPVRSRAVGAYLSEGEVAGQLGKIQSLHPNVDLGSYPFYREEGYGTNLVMRGTDESELDEMLDEVKGMIIGFGAKPLEE